MLPKALIPIIAVAFVCAVAFYGFTANNYAIHALLILTPMALMLAGNRGLILGIIISLRYSDLIVPGLPQGLNLMDVMILFLVAIVIFGHSIDKQRMVRRSTSHYVLMGFLVVLMVIMSVRGFGIRFLGSAEWGGFGYVKIFIVALFYLFCANIDLTEKQLKRALLLMLVLSFIPAAAQILFFASGGAIYHQYAFLDANVYGLLDTLNALQGANRTSRLYFSGVASALSVIGMAFFPYHGPKRFLLIGCVGTSFIITLLSGFRGAVVANVAIIFLYLLLTYPKRRFTITVGTGVAAATLVIGLIPFFQDLPASIQRALSFIPFYDVPGYIKFDADYSVQWRIDVWKESLRHLPSFLFIGRGLTFNPTELSSAMAIGDTIAWGYIGHNYHSGPISLAIITGVPGFILYSIFMVVACVEYIRARNDMFAAGCTPFVLRTYNMFLAMTVYHVFSFYVMYGSVQSSVPYMLFNVAFMQILRYNFGLKLQMNAFARPAPLVPPRDPAAAARKVPLVDQRPRFARLAR